MIDYLQLRLLNGDTYHAEFTGGAGSGEQDGAKELLEQLFARGSWIEVAEGGYVPASAVAFARIARGVDGVQSGWLS